MAVPSKGSDYELLTEHFGYPPVALLDDAINTVNLLADRALDSVERLLLSIPPRKLGFVDAPGPADESVDGPLPPDQAAKREIESGTHQLETLLNAAIDKNFDLFELYTMRNILTVQPQLQPYMLLPHYQGLDWSADDHPDRPSLDSITALRRRLQASQRLHLALEQERARNDALLRQLKSLLDPDPVSDPLPSSSSPFAFLRNRGNLEESGSSQPITTTTEFALSQLQALRSLSASLQALVPGLRRPDASPPEENAADAKASDPPSWRRQRAHYVEASSRKLLERAPGLELGPQGDVRDGEWQGGDRAPTKAEVDGLEKVAAALGSDRLDPSNGPALAQSKAPPS